MIFLSDRFSQDHCIKRSHRILSVLTANPKFLRLLTPAVILSVKCMANRALAVLSDYILIFQVQQQLDASSVWSAYKDQMHDLFISETPIAGYLTGGFRVVLCVGIRPLRAGSKNRLTGILLRSANRPALLFSVYTYIIGCNRSG